MVDSQQEETSPCARNSGVSHILDLLGWPGNRLQISALTGVLYTSIFYRNGLGDSSKSADSGPGELVSRGMLERQ